MNRTHFEVIPTHSSIALQQCPREWTFYRIQVDGRQRFTTECLFTHTQASTLLRCLRNAGLEIFFFLPQIITTASDNRLLDAQKQMTCQTVITAPTICQLPMNLPPGADRKNADTLNRAERRTPDHTTPHRYRCHRNGDVKRSKLTTITPVIVPADNLIMRTHTHKPRALPSFAIITLIENGHNLRTFTFSHEQQRPFPSGRLSPPIGRGGGFYLYRLAFPLAHRASGC